MLNHNTQIMLFVLFILIVLFIYNMDYKQQIDIVDIKQKEYITNKNGVKSDVHAYSKDMNKNVKNVCKLNDDGKYEMWKKQWTGRNNPTKRCQEHCQGLRKHEHLYCSEKCVAEDPFYKY